MPNSKISAFTHLRPSCVQGRSRGQRIWTHLVRLEEIQRAYLTHSDAQGKGRKVGCFRVSEAFLCAGKGGARRAADR